MAILTEDFHFRVTPELKDLMQKCELYYGEPICWSKIFRAAAAEELAKIIIKMLNQMSGSSVQLKVC
ncbi:hypothetical protein [Paraburkholderia flava]|uniref:hypothetical protein n=1 Tax=Paraburkholderia flava TaxID=2547393 RepID=UPI00105ED343|nr:hypothetical protein [Paraburkholderia flava]